MRLVSYMSSTSTAESYAIKISNQSQANSAKYFVIYQVWPSVPDSHFMVAWFAQAAARNTNIYFDWDLCYSFVWAKTGKLNVGAHFNVGENSQTQLQHNNKITLNLSLQGAYQFIHKTTATPLKFSIHADSSIPPNQVTIGLAMGSSGSVASPVSQAELNLNYFFLPNTPPEYYIAFTTQAVATGEVINPQTLSGVSSLKFPTNTFGADAVLQANNTWRISYVPKL